VASSTPATHLLSPANVMTLNHAVILDPAGIQSAGTWQT
jgi:hypothetical protein